MHIQACIEKQKLAALTHILTHTHHIKHVKMPNLVTKIVIHPEIGHQVEQKLLHFNATIYTKRGASETCHCKLI